VTQLVRHSLHWNRSVAWGWTTAGNRLALLLLLRSRALQVVLQQQQQQGEMRQA
jgi:hypothetical protein